MNIASKIILIGYALFSTSTLLAEQAPANSELDKEYVAGFITALKLTQSQQISIEKDQVAHSDFFKRAFKSRIGREPSSEFAKIQTKICVPASGMTDPELNHILNHYKTLGASGQYDKDAQLLKAIHKTYPCG